MATVKSVLFESSAPTFHETPERTEKSALWMTKKEYAEIRAYEKNLMLQVCQGLFVEGDQDSFRGLEARVLHEKRLLAGVKEVLLEQSAQVSLGYSSEESIARIYIRCTRAAVKLARDMAKKDARIAAAIQQQQEKDRPATLLHGNRPFGLLKRAKSFRESLEFSFSPPRIFRRNSSNLETKRRLSLEGRSPSASERVSMPFSDSSSLKGIDRYGTSPSSVIDVPLNLHKQVQPSYLKTVYIPSQVPFVGGPSQLLPASPKTKIVHTNAKANHSIASAFPTFEPARHQSSKPLLPPNSGHRKRKDDDTITVSTVASIESTRGFLMKPMCARICS